MIDEPSRLFAIIPAAGLSLRMGTPKLLLPFGNATVIARVLAALGQPAIVTRCVVVRRDDHRLRAAAEAAGAWCVSPHVDPPDMRRSVEFALDEIRQRYAPSDRDGWLLVPADHPVLSEDLVAALMAEWSARVPLILVPRCGNRRGHPTLFRWSMASDLERIPRDFGLNWLLQNHASEVAELIVDEDSILTDLDTPEDYERMKLA